MAESCPERLLCWSGAAPSGDLYSSECARCHLKVQFDGGWLAPGLVDLQVNGGGGVLFNKDQHIDAIAQTAEAHANLGVAHFLPTLISDLPEVCGAAVRAVEAAIGAGIPGIDGLHLEGPTSAIRARVHMTNGTSVSCLRLMLTPLGRSANVADPLSHRVARCG